MNYDLADVKNLVMDVVRNAVAKHNQEVKQEFFECLISRNHFGSNISKNKRQEAKHIQTWRIVLADVSYFLQVREDNHYKVDFEQLVRCALLDNCSK